MPAGIQIFNTFGTTQIDENWKNFGFKYKFAVPITAYATSPPNPTGFNGMTYGWSVAGTEQMVVACKASLLKPVKMQSYYNAGSWNFNWLLLPPTASTASETIEFYVFDAMDSVYSNVGIEVFNAAGQRVYHSDAPVMRLGSESVVGIQPCNTSFTGDPGRTYVPLILANPLVSANVGLGNRLFSYGLNVSGNSIISSGTMQLGAQASLTVYDQPGLYAAVDVTGL